MKRLFSHIKRIFKKFWFYHLLYVGNFSGLWISTGDNNDYNINAVLQ